MVTCVCENYYDLEKPAVSAPVEGSSGFLFEGSRRLPSLPPVGGCDVFSSAFFFIQGCSYHVKIKSRNCRDSPVPEVHEDLCLVS